jgi:hypothetical protein
VGKDAHEILDDTVVLGEGIIGNVARQLFQRWFLIPDWIHGQNHYRDIRA